jgi:DNA-binding NarL/FixJ family response regulator
VKRVLLVCSSGGNAVEESLIRAGCVVSKSSNGEAAVLKVRHEIIDAAVLISTGREMDLTETALTLRDINSSVEIIVLMDPKGTRDAAQTDAVAHAIPKTRILTASELNNYFASPEWQANPRQRMKR